MPQNQKQKQRQNRKKSLPDLFLRTLKDRYGYFDPKALTAFVSFVILIAIWYGDQFMGKKLNDLMVEVFAFLVFSLLGLKVLPWKKQGMITEHERQEQETPEELK
jgi:hypothetical protein